MKYRFNTIDKRIVNISEFNKTIQIEIYIKNDYGPILSFYADRLTKYPFNIDFILGYELPTSVRTEYLTHKLKYLFQNETTKFYRITID